MLYPIELGVPVVHLPCRLRLASEATKLAPVGQQAAPRGYTAIAVIMPEKSLGRKKGVGTIAISSAHRSRAPTSVAARVKNVDLRGRSWGGLR